MANGGSVVINLNLNSTQFNRNWNNAMNTVQRGQRQVNNASSSMTSGFNRLGKAVAAAFSVKVISDFTMSCIELGSELSEIQNVVDTVFGSASSEIDKFAKTAITTIGLSETVAKKYAGTFGAMAKSFGYSTDQAVEMSKELTSLVGNVASFYNLSSDEAYTKIKAVFTGETESLKELGVVMTQTALDQYALANGFGKTTKQMTELEKVELRRSFVLSKLSDAQGDFLRTQDGWANQTRVLKLQWEQFMATMGQGLINVFTPLIRGLNELVGTLQNVANGFKEITEAIFGVQEAASGGSGSKSGIVSDMENVEDSAVSAQKAVSKMTTSFDELNKVGSTSGGGASSSVGFDTDITGTDADEDQQENKWAKTIQSIRDMFNPLLNEFKEGFNEVFDPEQLNPIKDNIESIGQSLKDIFTSNEVQNSVNDFSLKSAKALGRISGAATSTGATVGTLITGSIANYLEENEPFLISKISSIVDNLSEGIEQAGEFAASMSDIFEVFASPEAQSIGGDFIEFFVNPLLSGLDMLTEFRTDLYTLVTQPIIDNSEKIKTALQDLLGPIGEFTSTMSDTATWLGEQLTTLYSEHIGPFFDDFTEGISKLTDTFLTMWSENIQPILERLSTRFTEIMETSIKPALSEVFEFVGKVTDILTKLWHSVLQPLVDWIVANILPVIAPIFETLGNVAMTVFEGIANSIGNVFEILNGILDFVVSVFTGDWEAAWEAVKDIFKGIWDSFVDIVKTPLNLIIDIINGLIGKINGALNIEVPDWVPGIGGQSWGLDIPTIPHLEKGAALYKPTLFLGGEYAGAQNNPEIVSKKSEMADAVMLGIKSAGGSGNQPVTIHVHNYLFEGQEQFSEFIINANEQYRYRMS